MVSEPYQDEAKELCIKIIDAVHNTPGTDPGLMVTAVRETVRKFLEELADGIVEHTRDTYYEGS